jgi:hypothetical protein
MKGAKIAFKTPIKMNRRLSLYTTVSHGSQIAMALYAPANQCCSILALQEHLPHLSPSVKQVLHQTKLKVPLKGTRECAAFALFCGPPGWEWYTQVKELFVEQCNKEVLLPHDAIGDVVSV